jgi:homoserine kinase
MELVEKAHEPGALGATISGAGPTVLVWTTWQDARKVTEAREERCGEWAETRRIPSATGAQTSRSSDVRSFHLP